MSNTDQLPRELPLLRFIPFTRADIVDMCVGDLNEPQQAQLQGARAQIEAYFASEFHTLREDLKRDYAPLDPDTDTRSIASGDADGEEERVIANVEQVLERANYERVSEAELQRAFDAASLFHVRLFVDFNDFENVLVYFRGASHREQELSTWFGLSKKTVRFINLERVVLLLRFKAGLDDDSTLGGCRPGATMLKLFQNVPDADLEMIFPNTRVGMRLLDKLMIGIPALVSGTMVVTTKLGGTLVLLGSLLGFWLGMRAEPVELDRGTTLVLLAGLGAVGGYLWKQFSGFRNRKLKFTQALTRNLYFKLLDNNAGVIFRLLSDAEDSEVKESLLAYTFLLQADEPLGAEALDNRIEQWLKAQWQCAMDFEIEDALQKLQGLGLAERSKGQWRPLPPP